MVFAFSDFHVKSLVFVVIIWLMHALQFSAHEKLLGEFPTVMIYQINLGSYQFWVSFDKYLF